MENPSRNSLTNGFRFIENILGLRTWIFHLEIFREVVGSERAAKKYLLAVVELGVGGWLGGWVCGCVALVILLLTKVQIFGFFDFGLDNCRKSEIGIIRLTPPPLYWKSEKQKWNIGMFENPPSPLGYEWKI